MIEQPKDGTLVTSDITYNLAQSARLQVDTAGNIIFKTGEAGFNPTRVAKTEGTLPLYDVRLNPATLNESDLSVSKIDHKRFTMKDIGRLEKRVDTLEEVTALSMLEMDTSFFQVLDSAGNDRTKSGFLVDNFIDAVHVDKTLSTAAIDPIEHCVRPPFKEDNIRLLYDSAASPKTIFTSF